MIKVTIGYNNILYYIQGVLIYLILILILIVPGKCTKNKEKVSDDLKINFSRSYKNHRYFFK